MAVARTVRTVIRQAPPIQAKALRRSAVYGCWSHFHDLAHLTWDSYTSRSLTRHLRQSERLSFKSTERNVASSDL